MKKFFIKNILFIGLLYVAFSAATVHASVSQNVSGYAWSDNIGWIKFNDCPTPGSSTGCASSNGYGVTIDKTTGNFSGYAWSSTIGWISFNASDVSGCPAGTCQAKLNSNGEVTGWARALGNSVGSSGGWDGWISFNCSNTSTCGTSNYKTTLAAKVGQTRAFGGYAWGSDVVGWIDMTGATYYVEAAPLPDLSITASPQYVATGGSTKLSWTSTNTTSCEVESADAVSGWSAGNRNLNQANPPGYSISNITSTTVYWISCYNPDNVKVRKGVLVSVGNPDFSMQTPSPQTIAPTGGSCASYTQTLVRANADARYGWTDPITFTASSSTLPGATYTFYTLPSRGGTSSSGSIVRNAGQPVFVEVTPSSALTNNHVIEVKGTSNGVVRTTTFTLCGSTTTPPPPGGGTGIGTRLKTIFREI